MPYTYRNQARARKLLMSPVWSFDQLFQFWRSMEDVLFSVTSSRMDGALRIADFLQQAPPLRTVLGNEQYPAMDIYYTTDDSLLMKYLSDMQSALAFRSNNQAKDVEAGRTSGRQTDANNGQKEIAEQGIQDQSRAWQGLKDQLISYINTVGVQLTRENYELQTIATWAN